MKNLKDFKIIKYSYPFSSEKLGEMIWDKMTAEESKWAVQLTLKGISDTGDDIDSSWDIFFLDEKLKTKIDEILNKYNVPYQIEDQTDLLLDNTEKFSKEFIDKLYNFLNDNLSIDEVLDNILEVGHENMTIFEKFFLDKNVNQRNEQ